MPQGPVAAGDRDPPEPPPSRWTLRTIRAAVPDLADYTLSGVWRVLRRADLGRRAGRIQQFSPDPDYATKLAHLEACLGEAATDPTVALVFLDEMGYARWPEPGYEWGPVAPAPPPLAARHGAPNRLWRLVGALNAVTGQVDHLDGYIVGRKQLIRFYHQLDAAYAETKRLSVVQDNWSIHRHDDVLGELAALPRIEPVWLPTYAPWLNPIEKLWGWLRAEVLTGHRLAADWAALQARVRAFLDRFRAGSDDLRHSVGLLGDGRLARALRPS